MAKAKPQKTRKKSKTPQGKKQIILIGIVILSAVFLPTACLVFISLMPMFVAFFVDQSRKRYKAVTVGATNIAGCFPFLLELWTSENTLEKAFSIIMDPMAISVVYASAGVGYLIDWAVTIFIASLLYQSGQTRLKEIKTRQEDLVKRWGVEVNGTLPLDAEGFPLS